MATPPSPDLHDTTRDVLRAGATVLAHAVPDSGSFWRYFFGHPRRRHYLDEVRAFLRTLGDVLDVPPGELGRPDLQSIQAEVGRVIEHIEGHVDASDPQVAQPLVSAVYALRARLEEILRRNAGRL